LSVCWCALCVPIYVSVHPPYLFLFCFVLFSMRSVSYQREVGDRFFQEFLVVSSKIIIFYLSANDVQRILCIYVHVLFYSVNMKYICVCELCSSLYEIQWLEQRKHVTLNMALSSGGAVSFWNFDVDKWTAIAKACCGDSQENTGWIPCRETRLVLQSLFTWNSNWDLPQSTDLFCRSSLYISKSNCFSVWL
jgi:hypothetical protein